MCTDRLITVVSVKAFSRSHSLSVSGVYDSSKVRGDMRAQLMSALRISNFKSLSSLCLPALCMSSVLSPFHRAFLPVGSWLAHSAVSLVQFMNLKHGFVRALTIFLKNSLFLKVLHMSPFPSPLTCPHLLPSELTILVLILVKEFVLRGLGTYRFHNELCSFFLTGYLRKCQSIGCCSELWARCCKALPVAVGHLPCPVGSWVPPLGKFQQMPASTLLLYLKQTGHGS